ncbi:hypothetical protein CYLTODRAFT_495520 [Cylindrobasidium torrendii FP15055 ss-10]|uniref:DUF6532 domain-containing protein n=1 Tax=Cylindrobasidium torrendii FP15055 ss-10 TaxID=1314674 RepID=A0A0D7AR15_9AGAR|nr:hypothetical protein CYLTODRAFT_495520 [Cylindrobasidium torrendii FP15055 ss-10]
MVGLISRLGRTFNPKAPYQADWLPLAIHKFAWIKKGYLDKMTGRALISSAGIPPATTFALFGAAMCHCVLEYKTGKKKEMPFDAAANNGRYIDKAQVASELSSADCLLSAPKDSDGEDEDDFDFAMLNEAADDVFGA